MSSLNHFLIHQRKVNDFLFEQHIDRKKGSLGNSLAGRLQTQPSHLMSPSGLNDSDSITKSAIGDNVNKFFQDENDKEVHKLKTFIKGTVLLLLKYLDEEKPSKQFINLLSIYKGVK